MEKNVERQVLLAYIFGKVNTFSLRNVLSSFKLNLVIGSQKVNSIAAVFVIFFLLIFRIFIWETGQKRSFMPAGQFALNILSARMFNGFDLL